MRFLAVDVGTGTQDILLLDTEREIENALQLVMPSPTMIVARAIEEATRRGQDILLSGVTMGGGPCQWAAERHLKAGYRVYATPEAARTFNDVLEEVEALGVRVVSEEEAGRLRDVVELELADLDLGRILWALEAFDVQPELDCLAVAVFDHGNAPAGYSDRLFRFDYLREVLERSHDLVSFAHLREEIPERLTRLAAVARTAPPHRPLLVMDTAPAAVLGALEDPRSWEVENRVVANVGNFHCLAFHLRGGEILGLFEHHTGLLSREELEGLLLRLGEGALSHEEVFAGHGHGALVYGRDGPPQRYVITGPRRRLLQGSSLPIYLAVPHGDMMLAGCFGLLRALGEKVERFRPAIEASLGPRPPAGRQPAASRAEAS